jgi:creatinine amidohydrolase
MRKEYEPVCYELLRPGQVRAIRDACPIVYIPIGSLEWHGVQNPMGTDSLKAHAICCDAALRYGGVVLPPFYLGLLGESRGWGPEDWDGFTVAGIDRPRQNAALTCLARGLVANDWKVLVGVTGHDVEPQRDSLHEAIQAAVAGTDAKGFAVTEGENWEGGASMKYSMDHAGAWETSTMMFAYPNSADLEPLREQMTASGRTDLDKSAMKDPEGIGGWNPLKYASAELGERIVRFCADRIGKRAVEVLEGKVEPLEQADKSWLANPGPTD